MKDLDEKLAASVDKSVEEALLLVSKEAALKEVESQLAAAEERSSRFEKEASRWGVRRVGTLSFDALV